MIAPPSKHRDQDEGHVRRIKRLRLGGSNSHHRHGYLSALPMHSRHALIISKAVDIQATLLPPPNYGTCLTLADQGYQPFLRTGSTSMRGTILTANAQEVSRPRVATSLAMMTAFSASIPRSSASIQRRLLQWIRNNASYLKLFMNASSLLASLWTRYPDRRPDAMLAALLWTVG
jgi:hypothetical protein